jgi:uncharacterized membrane protein YuzA (DUF378 family)
MATTHPQYSPNVAVSTQRPGRALDVISLVLLIVGGLNWGLVGLFGFDLVAFLFGDASMLSRAVYVIVGVAALWGIVTAVRVAKGGH